MGRRGTKLVITERQQEMLREMTVSRVCAQGLAQRAGMILGVFEGDQNGVIAGRVGCERHAVGRWRRRWRGAFEQLIHAECAGRPGELRRQIETILGDAPRAGRRCRIEPDQVAMIIAVACEPPEQSGRPISHWTHPELADEVVKRGIVPAISARHVGRFLKDRRPSTPPQPPLAEREGQGHARVSTPGPTSV